MRTGIAAALAAVLSAGSAAWAEDLRVPGDHRNLRDALAAARPGDRILLGPGRWRANHDLATPGVSIVGGPRTRILGRRGSRTRGARPALWIFGEGSSVRGVTFDGAGVRIAADGVSVEGCTFRRFRDPHGRTGVPIFVDGDGAVLKGNRILRDAVASVGVQVAGAGVVVSGNLLEGKQVVQGILVAGDEAVVEENDVLMDRVDRDSFNPEGIILAGSDGILRWNRVSSANVRTVGARNRIEGNVVRGTELGRASILVDGDGNSLEGNSALEGEDTGILVRGNGNTVRDCTVSGNGTLLEDGAWGHGFVVRGSGNVLVGDVATGSRGDAFRLVVDGSPDSTGGVGTGDPAGAGNVLIGCTGEGARGCGLANWTPGTSCTGSIFTGNGLDVVDGGGFSVFDRNTWSTGGPGFSGGGAGGDAGDLWGDGPIPSDLGGD